MAGVSKLQGKQLNLENHQFFTERSPTIRQGPLRAEGDNEISSFASIDTGISGIPLRFRNLI